MKPLHQPIAQFAEFPDHARLIASILGMWNGIEDACAQLLPLLTGTAEVQADLIMTAMQSSKARLDVLRAAAKFTLRDRPDVLKDFNDVFG